MVLQVDHQPIITSDCPHVRPLSAAEADALQRRAAIWLSTAEHTKGEPKRQALAACRT
jgi:hypothetical protein